jgi:hypothetical protein
VRLGAAGRKGDLRGADEYVSDRHLGTVVSSQ